MCSKVVFIVLFALLMTVPMSPTPRMATIGSASTARQGDAVDNASLNGHPVVLDSDGNLLSWADQGTAYSRVMQLAWDFIENKVPDTDAGVKSYLTYCCFPSDPPYRPEGIQWFHNPAGLYAMFTDSLLSYYPYSGDNALIPIVQEMLDYQLAHGTTPSTWDWPDVPFASARNGDTTYSGDGDASRDGADGIEPDKVGELGYAYLRFWELTGETVYRDAAIATADALARHVRAGNATQSPWPFRVDGQTGEIREDYSSSVVGPVRLFDELIRLNMGDVARYRGARDTAWDWALAYPLQNNEWHAYYEDVSRDPGLTNYNQLTAMETARYILDRDDPGAVDPQWRTHIPALIDWVGQHFGRGPFRGALGIDEQTICCGTWYGLGSDTARWASINARLYELTGDARYKDNAFRAFNLATYFTSEDGVVASVLGGLLESSSISEWFSDSYADYIKHFMYGIGAVPKWAPAGEDHLVRSSSVVQSIAYAPSDIRYTTFDPQATEVLRLSFTPTEITEDGAALQQSPDAGLRQEGWVYDDATGILRIRHDHGSRIVISGAAAPTQTTAATQSPTPDQATVTLDDTTMPSPSGTATGTSTPTSSPSATATATTAPTSSLTPTTTNTDTPATAPDATFTATPSSTPTPTDSSTATTTPFPTTDGGDGTYTASPSSAPTTATNTNPPTSTPVAGATSMSTATGTDTPVSAPGTPSTSPSAPEDTAVHTSTPASTPTPAGISTPTTATDDASGPTATPAPPRASAVAPPATTVPSATIATNPAPGTMAPDASTAPPIAPRPATATYARMTAAQTPPAAPTHEPRTPAAVPSPTGTARAMSSRQATSQRGASPARAQMGQAAPVGLAVNGQVWRGRARVDLALSVTLSAGRAHGQLRVRDAAARLLVTSVRVDRPRLTRRGMLVAGTARMGRRTVPFTLDLEVTNRATTVVFAIAPLRYRLDGAFHGHLVWQRTATKVVGATCVKTRRCP